MITWNIDEARATIRAQMVEANRLDEVIDDLSAETSAAVARAEAAEAEAARLRAQVATLLPANAMMAADMGAAERDNERLRAQVAEAVRRAQAALNAGGDKELVFAPLYQQALEDIAALAANARQDAS